MQETERERDHSRENRASVAIAFLSSLFKVSLSPSHELWHGHVTITHNCCYTPSQTGTTETGRVYVLMMFVSQHVNHCHRASRPGLHSDIHTLICVCECQSCAISLTTYHTRHATAMLLATYTHASWTQLQTQEQQEAARRHARRGTRYSLTMTALLSLSLSVCESHQVWSESSC